MNVLVTGGAGFIGSHFVLRHKERFPDDFLVVLDKLTYAGKKEYLQPVLDRIRFIHGDITNTLLVADLAKQYAIDAMVNFAAETHVDRSIQNAVPFIHTNILGVQSLIEVCKKSPHILLLNISTDEVYGDLKDGDPPCTVDTVLRPSSPYAATKAAGDLLLLSAIRTFGIHARITRCTNNYGPHQADEKFLPTVIRHAMKDERIPVYREGKNKRDWLYVSDHTDAIELVLTKGKDGQIYLIAADAELQNIDAAKQLLSVLGKPHSLIEFVEDRPGHDWRYALDASSILALDWKPKISFEDGLRRTVEWYRRAGRRSPLPAGEG
ncbi:dTDP-glucose 4,6-dehydratase [Candidatus Peribacteria bacterium RIFCSPLOWO2_12_FULL_55_15]|nr:MAG: dTDP-glucose 4,6-dehydratase [Candidatus Peribacteria bacterium RIFCSPHIGHO2_02_FULL_55_24]OGJ70498.1 MAG: dTDP-glucose 4,6-dehydratase [Candidatus Peribacteria bacterium RIFCSPLOWO2_12_FULL_55_15]